MESVLKRLDNNNGKHLYSQLYKIRSEYINNESSIVIKVAFAQFNGIERLVKILGKRLNGTDSTLQNEKIIEVILSIVGNCTCNVETCADQAFEANIIEQLISIVNSIENPSILSKACRLIGNLAQFQKLALSLQQKGISLSISNCLQEDAHPAVLTMAIRVIRLMWSAKKFRFEILSFGSIYKIMVVLYKLLKNEDQNPHDEEESDVVILKRPNKPDRTISKEKLSLIIEKIEKHDVEISYEVTKPERRKTIDFLLPIEKEKLELVSGIIKCLLTLTTASSSQVARSVYADGFGIYCLMFLAGDGNKFRSSSLNIISNLSSNPLAQEYLGINNDLVSNVAGLLLNSEELDKPLEQGEKKFCFNILCLSSENACNRGKLRRSGVFKSLLSIANNDVRCDKDIALLIFTFYQFRFDQLGLDTLLELGFIDVMMKVLAKLLETKDVDHIKFDDPSLDDEKKEELKVKTKKRSNVDTLFNSSSKYIRYDPGSPSSSSSGHGSVQQFSPCRNSGYSPFNSPSRSFVDDGSDSDIYSPVCSDNEEETSKKEDFNILNFIYENDEIGKTEEETLEIEDETSNMTLKEESQENQPKRSENIPETLKQIEADPVQYILQLLWKVSINSSDANAFIRPPHLLTLYKVCGLVQRPNGKVFQILQNILTQTRNFVSILKQDFLFKIHKLSRPSYDHQNCYSCSKMKFVSRGLLQSYGSVAESGYGRGEFAHFLLTGDEEMKKKVAVNLTYVISCPDILSDLLFKYRALEFVMEIILSEGPLAAEACVGLTLMSNNLNIQVPSDDDVLQRIIPEDFVDDDNDFGLNRERIKFVLSDGETFFDKETLMNSSDVFNSMFSGDFRESVCNEVKFPDYTIEGMKYFYHILKLQKNGKLKQVAPKTINMNVILQAYELSFLYILTNIQKPLLNIMKIVLDESNVLNIFEWSLRNINQDLLSSAICYFLCAEIEGESKLKLFLEANRSQFNKEWKKLIIDTILLKCQPFL